MATSAAPLRKPVSPDRIFYPILCALLLVIVWLGFSKTYYAAGMVHATLPSKIIHIHAAVATLWLITLIVQISLVSVRKVKLHMTVGLWGFGLAALWVPVSMAAARDALRRGMSPSGSGLSPETFLIVPISSIVLFAALAGWSYAVRRKPMEHKRLIMIATINVLDAAFGRFPYTVHPFGPMALTLMLFFLLAVMVVYDLITIHKVHRVTWIASLLVAIVHLSRVPAGQTALWQHFAAWYRGA